MTDTNTSLLLTCILLFGVVFGIVLIAYEDGIPQGRLKKILCRMGKHTFRLGYRKHVQKYFCHYCKSPRKHPELRAIEGGKKDADFSSFKF